MSILKNNIIDQTEAYKEDEKEHLKYDYLRFEGNEILGTFSKAGKFEKVNGFRDATIYIFKIAKFEGILPWRELCELIEKAIENGTFNCYYYKVAYEDFILEGIDKKDNTIIFISGRLEK